MQVQLARPFDATSKTLILKRTFSYAETQGEGQAARIHRGWGLKEVTWSGIESGVET